MLATDFHALPLRSSSLQPESKPVPAGPQKVKLSVTLASGVHEIDPKTFNDEVGRRGWIGLAAVAEPGGVSTARHWRCVRDRLVERTGVSGARGQVQEDVARAAMVDKSHVEVDGLDMTVGDPSKEFAVSCFVSHRDEGSHCHRCHLLLHHAQP